MFRKNVAGQFIHFQGVDAATGGIKSGVTWTVRRCIDGTFAAGGGTVTEDGSTGWYKYAMSQADTNGNNIAFNFTGTGAVPQTLNFVTTAGDPTDAVRFGLTALPNANAEAAGGLYTRGTGAGQINQPANGQIDANAVKIGGTTQTGRDIGASVLLSSGAGAGQLDFTGGVVKSNLSQILGTALTETAGQIAAAFKKFFDKASPTGTVNSLPDAVAGAASGLAIVGSNMGTVSSVTGNVGGSVASVTADVGITQTGADKVWSSATRTLTAFSTALAVSVWDVLTANISTASSIGLKLKNWVLGSDNKALLSSDAHTGATIPTVTTVTNGVTVTTNNDKTGYGLSSAAVQAIWDALTSALTTAGSIGKWILDKLDATVSTRLASASYASPLDAAGVRSAVGLASANLDSQLGAIDSKTTNLPASPAATGDIPTVAQIAEGMFSADSGQTYGDAVSGSVVKEVADNARGVPASDIADAVWSIITSTSFSFPSTAILDDFNRADEGPPPSENWTLGFAAGLEGTTEPGHQVISNELANTGSDINQNWYNAAQYGPDCEAYITVTNSGSVNAVGLAARLTDIVGFSSNGYYVQINRTGGGDNRNFQIMRIDNGGVTVLANVAETGVGSMTGDKYGIRLVGNNIELWADTGEGWLLKLTAVDSTYKGAGYLGILTDSSSSSVSRWDDFGGGDIIFPTHGSAQFNADAIADAVWDEDIVADHQTDDTAGKKLSQALILVE